MAAVVLKPNILHLLSLGLTKRLARKNRHKSYTQTVVVHLTIELVKFGIR